MEIRDTHQFRSLLESTLATHATQQVELLVVDDVANWARQHCPSATGNPLALAVRSHEDGSWGIVVRRKITDSEARSVVSRIGFYRTTGEEKRLSTPELFLQHL